MATRSETSERVLNLVRDIGAKANDLLSRAGRSALSGALLYIVTVLVAYSTLLAIFALSEVMERISARSLILAEISKSNEGLVDAIGTELTAFAASGSAPGFDQVRPELVGDYSIHMNKRQTYEVLLTRLSLLEAVGASNENDTLKSILTEFARTASASDLTEKGNIPSSISFEFSAEGKPRSKTNTASAAEQINPFGEHWEYLSNDQLLAWAVIAGGFLGAATGGLRNAFKANLVDPKVTGRLSSFVKDALLGGSAGIIVFFFLKSGDVLVPYGSESALSVSPYGGAFIAVLAGLFTEVTFDFFSQTYGRIIDRFGRFLDGPNSEPHSSNPAN